MDNYSILWDPNIALPSGAEIEPLANVRLSTVKPYDPYLDGYQFHHGAAIYQYGDTLYVSYARPGVPSTTASAACARAPGRSTKARAGGSRRAWWPTTSGPTGCRTAGETVLVQTSTDRGATWSAPEIMAPPPSGTGYSHGEFIACDGTLWALHAQFGDNPFPPPAAHGQRQLDHHRHEQGLPGRHRDQRRRRLAALAGAAYPAGRTDGQRGDLLDRRQPSLPGDPQSGAVEPARHLCHAEREPRLRRDLEHGGGDQPADDHLQALRRGAVDRPHLPS